MGDPNRQPFYVVLSTNHWNISSYMCSEYVKFFDGNKTEVFGIHGRDSASFNKNVQQILFGESRNITIQVSLINSRSYVKIDYGTLKQRQELGREK